MHGDILKGSAAEIIHKNETTKMSADEREQQIRNPNYIIFDFETDTSRKLDEKGEILLHRPMHVEIDILTVSDNHKYEESLNHT